MKIIRSFNVVFVATALLITAHRLPAPITEESPTPTVGEHSKKPRPKGSEGESHVKSAPKATATNLPRKFAGIWRGAINCGLCGNIEHRIIIDDAQKSMTVSKIGDVCGSDGTATASIGPDGITAQLSGLNGRWSLQPDAGGKTARVRLIGFMLDSSAVFTREQ